MNEEITAVRDVSVRVEGYADGVYNLALSRDGERERIEVDESEVLWLCEFLDVEVPEPEPTKPDKWG